MTVALAALPAPKASAVFAAKAASGAAKAAAAAAGWSISAKATAWSLGTKIGVLIAALAMGTLITSVVRRTPALKIAPVATGIAQPLPAPPAKPEEIPDEKPAPPPNPILTPRIADAHDFFSDLREQGIQVMQLGRTVELQVPVEIRFVATPARKLVEAIASAGGLKVEWIKDGAVAVLFRGEPDAEFA